MESKKSGVPTDFADRQKVQSPAFQNKNRLQRLAEYTRREHGLHKTERARWRKTLCSSWSKDERVSAHTPYPARCYLINEPQHTEVRPPSTAARSLGKASVVKGSYNVIRTHFNLIDQQPFEMKLGKKSSAPQL